METYRILSYEEAREAKIYKLYSCLVGPDGFECTLTEPEDRTWGRDLLPVVERLNEYAARIRELEAEIAERRMDYGEDCKRLDARIEELELRIADESRACALFQSHIRELEAQLSAAQDRERVLNDDLYYTCELAVAYAHSAADQEWAAKRIEELMPPEQEADHDN